jgi:hypothetical protein
MPKITLEIGDVPYQLLQVLADHNETTVEGVVEELVHHAQQGIYRPGSWERPWLCQAFGDGWTRLLQTGDPYGRPDSPMFNRPMDSPKH